MNVALMVITDGRWDYLQQTLQSAAECLDYPFSQRLLVDDSGESVGFAPDGFDIIRNLPRKGLAGAIQTGWDHLNDDIDFVFHLEDDFVFPDEVDIELMVEILEYEPELAQVALLRQPWSPEERQAGGIYSIQPERFKQKYGFVQQSHLFTFNPCLYPVEITKYKADLEAELTAELLADDWRFGYLGELGDDPKTFHIGVRRSKAYKL
jgi:glycosyltransferase involved in cell wall biosynthesis